jgi:hypothetical protein
MNIDQIVMAGLDPAIHAFAPSWIEPQKVVDHRVKPGDDEHEWRSRT